VNAVWTVFICSLCKTVLPASAETFSIQHTDCQPVIHAHDARMQCYWIAASTSCYGYTSSQDVTVFLGAQFKGTWMGRVRPVTFSSCLPELTSLVLRHICIDATSTSYFCPSVWLSVCPYAHIGAAPTGQIYVKFDTGDFIYQALYMNTYICFVVADDIKLPCKCSLWVKWY